MTILLTCSEEGSKEGSQLRFVVRKGDGGQQNEAAFLTTSRAISEQYRCKGQEEEEEEQQQQQQSLQEENDSFSSPPMAMGNGNIYSSQTLKNLRDLQEALNDFYGPEMNNEETESNSNGSTLTMETHTPHITEEEELRFELFRDVISHEDGLLNERVSWILLAQSFLMAPYVLAGKEPFSLRFVTATVGIISVVVTLPAILAAGRNIEVQKQVYFRQISSEERCQMLHGHLRDLKVKLNLKEEQNRKMHGHLLPTMAFRSNVAVPILWTALSLAAIQFIGWTFLLAAVILGWD